MEKVKWSEIANEATSIPSSIIREHFLQRIKDAKLHDLLTENQVHKVLVNHSEVIWKKVIPRWDVSCNEIVSTGCTPKMLNDATRGLKNNYWQVFSKSESAYGAVECNLDFLEKINQAFCASKNIQELCETQFKETKCISDIPTATAERVRRLGD